MHSLLASQGQGLVLNEVPFVLTDKRCLISLKGFSNKKTPIKSGISLQCAEILTMSSRGSCLESEK